MVFKSGDYVAQYINEGDLEDSQIQPNGVDLKVGDIFTLSGGAVINNDSKDLPDKSPIPLLKRTSHSEESEIKDDAKYYNLDPGFYTVRYAEKIAIPERCVGFVLPRSTIMRSGGMIDTAVWDSGYEGIGLGRMSVTRPTLLEEDSRIAQIVFAEAESSGEYDGQYQGENL